jgi:hypothetical protein
MDKIFNIIFSSIEFFLFLGMFVKLLYSYGKKKKFTTAGVSYFFGICLFLTFSLIGIVSSCFEEYGEALKPIKSFIYITSIIYLQIFFYKMSQPLSFENSITKANKYNKIINNNKKNMYIYSAFLFMIETLCVPIFLSSRLVFYELIPAICLLISFIYQANLISKIKNGFVIKPWTWYTVFTILFLTTRFFIENVATNELTFFNLVSVFLRTIQLIILSFILFKKDDLEVSLI